MNATGYTTSVNLTPSQKTTARNIGETMIAMRKGTATVDDYRTAMREGREQTANDDLFEIVKAHALAGATGGRA